MAKGVVIGTETADVGSDRLRRGFVLYVVVPRHIVELDSRVELRRNAMKLGGLAGVTRLVDQVAAEHHKGRLQSIRGGDKHFEIRRLLDEIPVRGIHAELRV